MYVCFLHLPILQNGNRNLVFLTCPYLFFLNSPCLKHCFLHLFIPCKHFLLPRFTCTSELLIVLFYTCCVSLRCSTYNRIDLSENACLLPAPPNVQNNHSNLIFLTCPYLMFLTSPCLKHCLLHLFISCKHFCCPGSLAHVSY